MALPMITYMIAYLNLLGKLKSTGHCECLDDELIVSEIELLLSSVTSCPSKMCPGAGVFGL